MTSEKFSARQVLIDGALMGIADLIPGISGGTVAFLLGIYHPLLEGIKSFNLEAFKLLFRFQFQQFFQKVSWKFLGLLLSGFAFSVLLFSHLIHFLLHNTVYKAFLYSFFIGLIFASIRSVFSRVRKWEISHWFSLTLGVLISLMLWAVVFKGEQWDTYSSASSFFHPFVLLCGMLAIWAMLLPGISGSLILLMFGMYMPTIEALKSLSSSLITFSVDMGSFLFLMNLGMGILIGLALFSRLILWLMKRWHTWVLAHMVGFMIGSLPSIWPFGSSLVSLEGAFSSFHFGVSLILMTAGFFSFALLQRLHQERRFQSLPLDRQL